MPFDCCCKTSQETIFVFQISTLELSFRKQLTITLGEEIENRFHNCD